MRNEHFDLMTSNLLLYIISHKVLYLYTKWIESVREQSNLNIFLYFVQLNLNFNHFVSHLTRLYFIYLIVFCK